MTDDNLEKISLKEGIQLYKDYRNSKENFERAENSFYDNKGSIAARGLMAFCWGGFLLYDSIVPGVYLVEGGEWFLGGVTIIAAAATVGSVRTARKNYLAKKQYRKELEEMMEKPEYERVIEYAEETK